MEEKFINRYNTFCKVLSRLEMSKSARPSDDFVLEGTIQNFNLTFDISWKVMKDILVKKLGILDFAIGSPREVLRTSFTNGLIESDMWLQMLNLRNKLAHDYDGSLAEESFDKIITVYYDCFEKFKNDAEKYI
jgi:nucleotidyltransferase substrate binding protein (TIGR01987 family)